MLASLWVAEKDGPSVDLRPPNSVEANIETRAVT